MLQQETKTTKPVNCLFVTCIFVLPLPKGDDAENIVGQSVVIVEPVVVVVDFVLANIAICRCACWRRGSFVIGRLARTFRAIQRRVSGAGRAAFQFREYFAWYNQ